MLCIYCKKDHFKSLKIHHAVCKSRKESLKRNFSALCNIEDVTQSLERITKRPKKTQSNDHHTMPMIGYDVSQVASSSKTTLDNDEGYNQDLVHDLSQQQPESEPFLREEHVSPAPPLLRRSGRTRRVPAALRDFVPSESEPIYQDIESETEMDNIRPRSESPNSSITARTLRPLITRPDDLGVYRVYADRPSRIPFDTDTLHSVSDDPNFAIPSQTVDPDLVFGPRIPESTAVATSSTSHPLENISKFRAMEVYYKHTKLSTSALDDIIAITQTPEFSVDHWENFRTATELRRLDKHIDKLESNFGWKRGSVKLKLPAKNVRQKESSAREFVVEGVLYRDLVDVMKSFYESPSFDEINLKGYTHMWQADDMNEAERLHGEAFTSDYFLAMEDELRNLPSTPNDNIECIIAPLIFQSDATHLANFGTASLWPFYGYAASQSKYPRGKPTGLAARHFCYAPSLPDQISDAYFEAFGFSLPPDLQTLLKRDLYQGIWKLLLNPEFSKAYKHGIIVECFDGILRRIFIHIFCYAADYPEKVLLASIKNMGKCLCPRCLITTKEVPLLGTAQDTHGRETRKRQDSEKTQRLIKKARKKLFSGKALSGKKVQKTLDAFSLVPVVNAFSTTLLPFGVNFYDFFVVDLMHEFELGVFKAVFIHLVRMCHLESPRIVQTLDARFRLLPSYGKGVIRRFSNNVSDMKKLAAHNYENILQCAAACFEGLFSDPWNSLVQDLLATMATWHGYAKYRLHTDSTLASFDVITENLGYMLRKFTSETSSLKTIALPSEEAAASRRHQEAVTRAEKAGRPAPPAPQRGKTKQFNLETPKIHFAGDYVASIRKFGTTDSYSTQNGELEHCRVKRFYRQTNKNEAAQQVAAHEARQRLFNVMEKKANHPLTLGPSVVEPQLPKCDPSVRYQISDSTRNWLDLRTHIRQLADDPAMKNFTQKLEDHLLTRLLPQPADRSWDPEEEFSQDQRNSLQILNNRMYIKKYIRFNYTTYDLRRAQDTVGSRNQHDIMVLSGSEDDREQNPYWFGCVISIFTVKAFCVDPKRIGGSKPETLDVLYVRWFGQDEGQSEWGLHCGRMPRIGFLPATEPGAFGLVNPVDVIRRPYIEPAFAYGQTDELMGPSSIGRCSGDKDKDYLYYYVNMWHDRDMMARFEGSGVGHKSTREFTSTLRHLNSAQQLRLRQPDDVKTVDQLPGTQKADSDTENPEPDAEEYLAQTEEGFFSQDEEGDGI